MFVHDHHRFLDIVAASVLALVFQSTLFAQVQASGSTTHYRPLGADFNLGDERLDLLGVGSVTV